jgi:hypothetical protein
MANEVDKRARLQSAMSKAAKLMQLESNGTLDKIAKAKKDSINESLNGEVATSDLMTSSRNRNTQAPTIRRMGENASNVPAPIREAFMKNPIDDSTLYEALGEQGDGRSLSFLTEGLMPKEQPQSVREIVNEDVQHVQPQVQYATSQIDYPMIRTIVEDIVRKYATSLNKKIVSEGKGNEISTIALGKNFRFLDSAGNIYECSMKKVGNVNDKKKSVNG